MVEAILFDLDGVLVESIDVWLKAFNLTLKDYNLPPISKRAFVEKHWGRSTEENFKMLGLGRDAVEKCWKYYLQNLDEVVVFPSVYQMLEKLRRTYKIGLVTNTPKEGVKKLLKLLKLTRYFDLILTGDDVKEGKPSPEIIFLACEKLGVKPEKVLLVGDTWVDVQAGKSAGCKVIGVGIEADYTIDNIKQLEHLLEDICT